MSFVSIVYLLLFTVSDFEMAIFEILIHLKITINSLYINIHNFNEKTLFFKICTVLKMF